MPQKASVNSSRAIRVETPVCTFASRVGFHGRRRTGLMNLNVVGMFSTSALLLGACVALNGCQSHRANRLPAIESTKIPPAAQGGKEKSDTIAGRVVGARPGHQIVIYARSGAWWVQPILTSKLRPVLWWRMKNATLGDARSLTR
jgi:hypothetical protein